MTLHAVTERTWPPQCCVPAFVVAALEALGHPVGVPRTMPSILGVQVGPHDDNPLELRVAPTPLQEGVSAADASARIEELLADLELPVAFFQAPVDAVATDAAEEFVGELLANGVVAGVGVQYDEIEDVAPPSARHILRITGVSAGVATVADDSGEAPQRYFQLPLSKLLGAARSARDGFWLFYPAGRVPSIFLTH